MSFIGDSRQKNGPGIVPVQDTGWLPANWKPQMRASLIGCRVTNRKVLEGDLGHYEHELVGDFGFGQVWERDTRFAPQWRWCPFGVLTIGEGGSSGGGGGGSGGGTGGGGGATTPGGGPGQEVPPDSRSPTGGTRAGAVVTTAAAGGASTTGGITSGGATGSTTTGGAVAGTGPVPATVTPPYAVADAELRPVYDKTWQPDSGFKKAPTQGKPQGWPSIPGGIVGTTTTGTRVDKEDVLFVWGDPRLIAANRGAGPYGTLVCDLAGNSVDPNTSAPLQSAFTVVPRLGAGILSLAGQRVNCLARTMTLSGQRDTLGGLSWDGQALSRDSIADGGYHDCGSKTDKHTLGRDGNGNPCNPAHLGTVTFFRGVGQQYDGPLEFQETKYTKPGPLPYKSRVHLRWDQAYLYRWPQFAPTQTDYGAWRWEAEYTFGTTTPSGPPVTITPGGGDNPPTPGPGTPGGEDPPGPTTPGGGGRNSADGISGGSNVSAEPPRYNAGAYVVNEQPSHGTHLETDFPGVVYRAARYAPGLIDYAHYLAPTPEQVEAWQKAQPATLRTVGFGQQGAAGMVYTALPGKGPFVAGSANGGTIDLPPEVSLADIGSDFAPDGVTLSRTQRIIGPGVEFGFGVPSLATGALDDGYLVQHTAANGLTIKRVAAGVETTVLQLRADGVAFLGNADAPPVGTPAGGGYLYASGGALRWKGSGGTITTIAPA